MTASNALEPVVSASAKIPSARRAAPGRIPELDGLRGAAIFFVILWHYFYFFPATDNHPQGTLRSLYISIERCIALGWSGVDLFFVLSGFLRGCRPTWKVPRQQGIMASTALETVASASSEIYSARRGIADRIPELDGMRDPASLGVMLFHYASSTPGA